MEETIDFSKKLFSSQTEYKVATPYPGTMLYDLAKENNWITKEGFNNLGGYTSSMKVSEEFDEQYVEKLADKTVADFYFNPRYLMRYIRRGDFLATSLMISRHIFKRIKNQITN